MRKNIISKEAIIQLAEDIIREEGLSRCSMRRLSRDLEVATGTIYNYYESRDKLLVDVFEISWKRTIAKIRENNNSELEPIDQIKEAIQILREDVVNRNGLGKELIKYRLSDHTDIEILDLKSSLSQEIDNILVNKMNDKEKCKLISRWIILIQVDKFESGDEWTELEWLTLEQTINTISK